MMDRGGARFDEGSSSPDLSSPPQSPEAPSGDSVGPSNGVPRSTSNAHGGALSSQRNEPVNATPQPATTRSKDAPAAPAKRQRKKKEPPVSDATGEDKPKRQRKPRDPNIPPQSRKRKKADPAAPAPAPTENEEKTTAAKAASKLQHQVESLAAHPAPAPAPESAPAPARQSKITDLIHQAATPEEQPPALVPLQPAPSQVSRPQPVSTPEIVRNQTVASIAAPSPPRPASSGQLFDPVRSATAEPRSNPSANNAPPVSPPAKVINRASASPSINSLIDPMPMERSATTSTVTQSARYQPPVAPTSAPVSPAMPIRPNSVVNATAMQQSRSTSGTYSTAMEVDSDREGLKKASVPMKKSDSMGASTASAAPTPPTRPVKPKEAPPPLPGTGSGLLSGTPLGPTLSSGGGAGQGANIWLTFPLKGQKNVTINFAREVEKKYGFAALHPRIAAQKERRRQMALAGAALEKASGTTSADEMSLDISEPESNVEMGGVDDEGSAAGGTKRKRRKRVDEYDKDDDFIDDTELAWEQQALMAKDGFFVYSGPLITEGEKPPIERADGTVRRGRGRGRGGSSRGGGAVGESSGRGSRGGGRGSRGGATVRKPRVTKADRAMMEQEKHEREKMAATLAAKQGQVFVAATTTA